MPVIPRAGAIDNQIDVYQSLASGDFGDAYISQQVSVIAMRFPVAGQIAELGRDLIFGDPDKKRAAEERHRTLLGLVAGGLHDIAAGAADAGRGLDRFVESVELRPGPEWGQMRRDLRALDRGLDRELAAIARRAAGRVATQASLLAPRRTGRLAASYRPFVRGRVFGARSRVPYAAVHEYGGVIRPRGVPVRIRESAPLTRATLRMGDAVVHEVEREFDQLVRRHGWT